MKSELFKDPFVAMMVAVRAAGDSKDLKRLLTDEEYLREQRTEYLEKEIQEFPGNMKVLIETLKEEKWRKTHPLSEHIDLSIEKLFLEVKADKKLWAKLDVSDHEVLVIVLRAAIRNIKLVAIELVGNTQGDAAHGLVRTIH
ncbi:hypothetical protein ACSB3K_004898 [Escherichia coli]|uniref:hypothetical protein n=1 Tax=Escherichia coli TaxID=562 RepID=UPI000A10C89C|nr:hypothetical protein [Escherichia coli]EIL5663427.1 hypothetical protein [Salmonella enterica]ORS93464.1 hypothetical protein BHS87_25840 [Escherichia coli]DAL76575.1 MAG TPA: hypothetical protein [Caudoviricetes sp.]